MLRYLSLLCLPKQFSRRHSHHHCYDYTRRHSTHRRPCAGCETNRSLLHGPWRVPSSRLLVLNSWRRQSLGSLLGDKRSHNGCRKAGAKNQRGQGKFCSSLVRNAARSTGSTSHGSRRGHSRLNECRAWISCQSGVEDIWPNTPKRTEYNQTLVQTVNDSLC